MQYDLNNSLQFILALLKDLLLVFSRKYGTVESTVF